MEKIINSFKRVANAIKKRDVVSNITDINQFDGFSDAIKCSLLNYHMRFAQVDVN